MRRSIGLMAFCLAVFAPLAGAYEYALQFTPNAGYRGLVVAGYEFAQVAGANGVLEPGVIGTCSYYTVSGVGSGKGGHGAGTHNYQQICTWDMHGNLLSVKGGVINAPPPVSHTGNLVIYAMNGSGDTTGTDSKLAERGFVSTPGGHYTWLTPNHNGVLLSMVYTLTVTLKSDGDAPVDIMGVTPSALHGIVTLKSATCKGEIAVGKTCSVTVTYDPTKLTAASGNQAPDTLRIDLTSDAAASHDFIQNFTVIVPGKL